MTSKTLLAKIIKIAEKKGWKKDYEQAKHIGVSASGWSRIKAGQRGIDSAILLKKVVKALPEVRDDVIEYVVGKPPVLFYMPSKQLERAIEAMGKEK